MFKQSNFLVFLVVFCFSAYAGVDEIFKGKTSISKPSKLRDPFEMKIKEKLAKKSQNQVTKSDNGVYSNIPQIGIVDLDKIEIIGVMVGANRSAVVKVDGNDQETFVLKEGMKLGKNQAEIKAILPGGIVLVEKLTNIYGDEEYLETVIPISK